MGKDCHCSSYKGRLCPSCKCRNTMCSNKVKVVNSKHMYYCHEHSRCGNAIGSEGPCKGCLKTFQEDSPNIK